ncbi:hypothetical protein [Chamaesiphon polymorphus]|uniref:Lipoprotein n=1 Tax=Chamaesiphon polymorphus CCALA 037 TaxID=2107692 RepID=A0A2T1GCH3_9CYAN|nr:hypothetical protein [Chamaesiphon polymorphus]PSB55078.1 hypothetical protein C7B77_16170 [Chamaesiphon polymorphus CCALA 037]
MKLISYVLIALVSISLVGCDTSTTQQGSDLSQEMSEREMDNRSKNSPDPQSSPTPQPSIDPFYGNGPGGSFYGNK